jgi:hypothetical protein
MKALCLQSSSPPRLAVVNDAVRPKPSAGELQELLMKPYVICHMCTTIDGKILGNRWGSIAGHPGSAHLFETTAASFGIGAWIVGTTTMKEKT